MGGIINYSRNNAENFFSYLEKEFLVLGVYLIPHWFKIKCKKLKNKMVFIFSVDGDQSTNIVKEQ